MPFVSVTRLRIRSLRFLPAFFFHAMRTQRQVSRAAGFRGGSLLRDAHWTFWTLTVWDSEATMRAYMRDGAHGKAMPKLMHWCDEASVVHWTTPVDIIPDWSEAEARMRSEGRPSKLRHPSRDHERLGFALPRAWTGARLHRHDATP